MCTYIHRNFVSLSATIVSGARSACRLAGRVVRYLIKGCAQIALRFKNVPHINHTALQVVQAGKPVAPPVATTEAEIKTVVAVNGQPAEAVEVNFTTNRLLDLIICKSIADVKHHIDGSTRSWNAINQYFSHGIFISEESLKECDLVYKDFYESFVFMESIIEIVKSRGLFPGTRSAEVEVLINFKNTTFKYHRHPINIIFLGKVDAVRGDIAGSPARPIIEHVRDALKLLPHAQATAMDLRKATITSSLPKDMIAALIPLIFDYSLNYTTT